MIIYNEILPLAEMSVPELDKLITELEGVKSLETELYYKHIEQLNYRIAEAKKVRFEKAVDSL